MIGAAVASLLLIVTVHQIYLFLRDTLTVPRVRDFVHKPAQRCSALEIAASVGEDASHAPPDVPPPDKKEMKAELGAFLQRLQRGESRVPPESTGP